MSNPSVCGACGGQIGSDSPNGMCPKCLFDMAKSPQQQATLDRHEKNHAPPKPKDIDALFPELEILDLLGQGGMGFVYKARQKNLGRIVAVKLLSPSLLDDPSFEERFSREARAMAMMNHPNIIAIYDFGCREKFHYLVMEYVDGLNLRQLVQSAGMNPTEAMAIVPQLCDALQYAHDRGVVHRDIKPENVLLSQDGQVKIADFGLAKLTNANANQFTLTQTQQVMGTLNYMAPEQREKPIEVDHRADIYSLGVMIYELLTGELPLGRFAPPSNKAKIDVRLDELVMRALEKEPNLRFQQISELKTGIEQLRGERFVNASQLSMEQPTGNSGFRLIKFIVMSCGVSIGIAGILLIIMSGLYDESGTGMLLRNQYITETTLQIAGFSGLALCGFVFAILGIYSAVFGPSKAEKIREERRVAEEKSKETKTSNFLMMLGMVFTFGCAAAFVLGSPIPGISRSQLGIGCALLSGLMYSIAGNFESNGGSPKHTNHTDDAKKKQ